jgi:hypothetical protein
MVLIAVQCPRETQDLTKVKAASRHELFACCMLLPKIKISSCSLSVHGVDHGVGSIITFQEAEGFNN